MDVTVTAALAWFEEPKAGLIRTVSSLAGVCDVLVAFDGRWAEFPGERHLSPGDESATIKRAARQAGVEAVIFKPKQPWASQIAKRASLMTAAAQVGDWILVIDGDEELQCPSPEDFKAALAHTTSDVARVMLRTVGGGAKQEQRAVRRLYRSSAGVTVETAHNGYRAEDGRWLHGDPAYVQLEEAADLSSLIRLEHDLRSRPTERRNRSLAYRNQRRRLRLEVWA